MTIGKDAVKVANGCTLGTYTYTSTTEMEMRLLHSSEAYLKWSHGRKATILEGHQRALRTNTQLLFVCFVVAVAMLLGGPVGGSSWWGLGGGETYTLNNLHLTRKAGGSARRTHTPSMSPFVAKYCSPTPTTTTTTKTSAITTAPAFIQKAQARVVEVGCDVAARIAHQDGMVVAMGPYYVFMGVFVYVLGFTLLLLPILHRFRLLQDRSLEIRDRAHDAAITSSITSTGVVTSLFEESPTILSPSVPLLLPTAKSPLITTSSNHVKFTNERELLDEDERSLLVGSGDGAGVSVKTTGLRPAAIGLMVVGLLVVEAHLCLLRSGCGGGVVTVITSSAMRSVTEWAVLAITIKAIALVRSH